MTPAGEQGVVRGVVLRDLVGAVVVVLQRLAHGVGVRIVAKLRGDHSSQGIILERRDLRRLAVRHPDRHTDGLGASCFRSRGLPGVSRRLTLGSRPTNRCVPREFQIPSARSDGVADREPLGSLERIVVRCANSAFAHPRHPRSVELRSGSGQEHQIVRRNTETDLVAGLLNDRIEMGRMPQ